VMLKAPGAIETTPIPNDEQPELQIPNELS
jgi:hypothetical protein